MWHVSARDVDESKMPSRQTAWYIPNSSTYVLSYLLLATNHKTSLPVHKQSRHYILSIVRRKTKTLNKINFGCAKFIMVQCSLKHRF